MFRLGYERWFRLAMYWRMIYGVLRLALGFAFLKLVGSPLLQVMSTLMSHELVEDPNDVLYGVVSTILNGHPVFISYFLAVYFIFWGVIDIALSYSLLRHKLWAFPIGMGVIGFFILYELVRLVHNPSPVLLGVIAIDVCILWLIGREHAVIRKKRVAASTNHF